MEEFEAIALQDFAHGDIDAVAGHVIWHRNGAPVSRTIADDLERAGLVRIRVPQGARLVPGKGMDDGRGQPSSVLHPAPASPTTTSPPSKAGERKTRKPDAS